MSLSKLDHILTILHRKATTAPEQGSRSEAGPPHQHVLAFYSSEQAARKAVGQTHVSVLVRSLNPASTAKVLSDIGGQGAPVSPRHISGKVPISALRQLVDHPHTISVSADRAFELEVNAAAAATGLTSSPSTTSRLMPEFTGSGVLIGVIDSGVDVTSEAFNDSSQKTRIVAYLDLDTDKSYGEYGTPVLWAANQPT